MVHDSVGVSRVYLFICWCTRGVAIHMLVYQGCSCSYVGVLRVSQRHGVLRTQCIITGSDQFQKPFTKPLVMSSSG